MRIVTVLAVISGFAVSHAPASGAESVILSAAAMKAALGIRPPDGLAAGDSDKPITFGTAGAMHDAVVAGAAFDVVILPPGPLQDLVKRGLVDPVSIQPLGTMRLGAAVAKGAPRPLIDTPDHFRQAILAATSIAMADPRQGATTGIYLATLFDRLEIAQTIAPKLKVFAEGQTAMEAVARGEVQLGLGQISEAIPVEGIDLVGPLPDALQLKTTYSAGIATNPADRLLAQKTMARLSGPSFKSVLKSQGFDVVP